MDIQQHFRFIAQTIKSHLVYSPAKDAWTIAIPHLKTVLEQHPGPFPPGLPTLDDILEEGVCRGLWEMDFDYNSQVDIVVIR